MYRVPSEFIKQKQTLFWFVTVEHVVGAFSGYLLAQLLGGGTVVIVVCTALGLALTTVKVQGLTLYRFIPLAVSFLVARVSNQDTVELDAEAEAEPATPAGAVTILDEQGRPIFFQEE